MQYLANKAAQIPVSEDINTKESSQSTSKEGALQGFKSQGFQSQGFQKTTLSNKAKVKDPRRFREDFGWKMTGDQYDQLVAEGVKFNEQLDVYKNDYTSQIKSWENQARSSLAQDQNRYNQEYGSFQGQYDEGKASIDKARGTLGNPLSAEGFYQQWRASDRREIQVVGPSGDVQATYMGSKAVLDDFHSKKGKDITGNWVDGGSRYNILTYKRGKEIHDLARDTLSNEQKIKTAFWNSPGVPAQYRASINEYSKAKSYVNNATSQFNEGFSQGQSKFNDWSTALAQQSNSISNSVQSAYNDMNSQIGMARSSRQGKLDAVAQAYKDRRRALASAYANLA